MAEHSAKVDILLVLLDDRVQSEREARPDA
jgi:hypothetical protein